MLPPTLVKEDEALPETADCRMDQRVVLRRGHDEPVVFLHPCVAFGELKYQPVVFCNPVLHSVN